MSQRVYIQLTNTGADLGPYNIFFIDGDDNIIPGFTNVPKDSLTAGYTFLVEDSIVSIKIESVNLACANYSLTLTIPSCVRPATILQGSLVYEGVNCISPENCTTIFDFAGGTNITVCDEYLNLQTTVDTYPELSLNFVNFVSESFEISSTLYLDNGTEDCSVVPNGWYWYNSDLLDGSSPQDYIDGLSISIIQVQDGVIQYMSTCTNSARITSTTTTESQNLRYQICTNTDGSDSGYTKIYVNSVEITTVDNPSSESNLMHVNVGDLVTLEVVTDLTSLSKEVSIFNETSGTYEFIQTGALEDEYISYSFNALSDQVYLISHKNLPDLFTPFAIDVSPVSTCPNRVIIYSVSAIPAGATSILWTIPSVATLVSGQGTTSITVSYPGTSVNDFITATPIRDCISGETVSMPVHLALCS